MARRISVIDASVRTWYTPDIDDNRADPDPFRVLISPLSGKEIRQLRSSLKLQATSLESEDLMQAAERREEELKALVIAQHVHNVEGFSAQHVQTGEVIEPKDGATLVECILDSHPDELIVLVDIYDAIMSCSSLSDDAKKKLNSQSDLQSQGMTGDKRGAAQGVAVKNIETKTGSENSAIVTAIPTVDHSVVVGSLG